MAHSFFASCEQDVEVPAPTGLVDCNCRESHLPQLTGAPSVSWKPGANWSTEGNGEQCQWSKLFIMYTTAKLLDVFVGPLKTFVLSMWDISYKICFFSYHQFTENT